MQNHRPVVPQKGAAPYIGGKRALAKRIIERIEAVPHETYAEVFVGMGGVFFRRRAAPPLEVINDYSRDVATFFRVLQRHYQAFLDMMKWQITTRAEFQRLADTDPKTLTDLERAARFYYLQKLAFGGRVSRQNFGIQLGMAGRVNPTRLAVQLEEIHARLAGVVIEGLPFDELLQRYDRADTLFYLDPPYWASENDYGKGLFGRTDFSRLATLLAGIEGRFLLSINDVPEIRRIFAAFELEEVTLTYSVAQAGGSPAKELIISGAARPGDAVAVGALF